MPSKIEALRGMEDTLPPEIEKWQWLEEKTRVFFESHFFKEIRTPIVEYTELFQRSVGESSDIVNKEMFSFEDRGGRKVTLRPEMTASVARAVIEKGLLKQAKSLRLYYMGPMFRAERPQAGRKRQFHQIGAEIVNEEEVEADFECIKLLCDFLKFIGLKNYKFRVNDLGDLETQKKMAQGLAEYFATVKEKLCKDCQWRLTKNVLRIFDCKVSSCRPLIDPVPWEKLAPVSDAFKRLLELLDREGIPFTMNRQLVRGLDYYNGPVFECVAEGLGAQDAVAGGGRYDRLHADLGGARAFCTGFSIGMERLLMALEAQGLLNEQVNCRKVYLAVLESSAEALRSSASLALQLRVAGFRVESQKNENSLGKHLKKANTAGSSYTAILGSDELKEKAWTLKNMKTGEQKKLQENEILKYLIHELDRKSQ